MTQEKRMKRTKYGKQKLLASVPNKQTQTTKALIVVIGW